MTTRIDWGRLAMAARARIIAGTSKPGDGILMFADCANGDFPSPSSPEDSTNTRQVKGS